MKSAGLVLLTILLVVGCSAEPDIDVDDAASDGQIEASPEAITAAAAEAMGEVESVRFDLTRTGAPVYIDELGTLAVDRVEGRVTVPAEADALITVTVAGNLVTTLGAVAVDGETWLSNPITGEFETLPDGYELDPSLFFDPKGGWQPLLEQFENVELVGVEDRGGERYHIRGTAPADRMEIVTARLVQDQDVVLDLWIDPSTGLVTAAEFDTVYDGETSSWTLELSDFGETFEISAPEISD